MRKALIILLVFGGCTGDPYVPGNTPGMNNGGGDGTAGGPNNTYNHENDSIDPFDLLQRLEQEGPPEISTRIHSCQKLPYRTIGRLLTSRGVDLSVQGQNGIPSAGDLYANGSQALGAPNYDARVAEAIEPTAAGATKLFDIFVQAAPQIIANLPSSTACPGVTVFDSAGRCNPDGLTCLLGYPATDQHLALCNQVIGQASNQTIGQTIAVATLMSAAHTCE